MGGKLVNKITVRASYGKSRVLFKPDDERMAQTLAPPALLLSATNCSVTARRCRLCRGERHFAAFLSYKDEVEIGDVGADESCGKWLPTWAGACTNDELG